MAILVYSQRDQGWRIEDTGENYAIVKVDLAVARPRPRVFFEYAPIVEAGHVIGIKSRANGSPRWAEAYLTGAAIDKINSLPYFQKAEAIYNLCKDANAEVDRYKP